MEPPEARALIAADARAAIKHYGGEVDIRTPALMRGKPVKVDKVHLVYDSDPKRINDETRKALGSLMGGVADETGVEVRFE